SIAQRLEVSDKWVYKAAKQYRETKHYEVRKSPGRPRKLYDKDLKALADLVRQFPDATLHELREKGELDISISSLDRYLLRMKITFKLRDRRCYRVAVGKAILRVEKQVPVLVENLMRFRYLAAVLEDFYEDSLVSLIHIKLPHPV
ncbi:MAG: hypothetical protein IJ702_04415, partial [Fretibacterium sp.]|nr:hypothetical protein [Fretibacterium sp.]